jgi:hypothetical protein
MRFVFVLFCILSFQLSFSQVSDSKHNTFCKNLNKVFELVRTNNLDAYDVTFVKQSPFLAVPGNSIQLERFPVTYVDKDERFVAKTNLNLDSLSASQTLEEFRSYVGYCLDSSWYKWDEMLGDDSYTPFFKELKQSGAYTSNINLRLAIISVAPKVYSINMYITRRK